MRILLLILIFLTLTSCGDRDGTSNSSQNLRLATGSVVDELASPQLVRIRYTFSDGAPGLCSGVVIAPGWVLSAAHCFTDAAGPITVENITATYSALRVLIHPAYYIDNTVSAIFNDIALVEIGLNPPLPQLEIAPSLTIDQTLPLSAWGFGVTPDGEVGTLRRAEVIPGIVTPNHVFASALCAGDSGGPLIAHFFDALGNEHYGVVGIGSSGFVEGCSENDTSLFTNLQNPEILAFIQETAPGVIIY